MMGNCSLHHVLLLRKYGFTKREKYVAADSRITAWRINSRVTGLWVIHTVRLQIVKNVNSATMHISLPLQSYLSLKLAANMLADFDSYLLFRYAYLPAKNYAINHGKADHMA